MMRKKKTIPFQGVRADVTIEGTLRVLAYYSVEIPVKGEQELVFCRSLRVRALSGIFMLKRRIQNVKELLQGWGSCDAEKILIKLS